MSVVLTAIGAGRSEKAIQNEIVNNLRNLGMFVTTFSQPHKASMTAGVPDLMVASRRWRFSLWIEVKRPERRNTARGGCTTDQIQWHANARECGMNVMVAYGWSDVLEELKRLGCDVR